LVRKQILYSLGDWENFFFQLKVLNKILIQHLHPEAILGVGNEKVLRVFNNVLVFFKSI